MVDREQLADFLRRRREALQPDDVGLVKGPRRRTIGLRREEVAALSSMSPDYYSRLEQQRGPQPSPQMVAAIARGMRLSQDERDHLFRLAGHTAPTRARRSDHVSPALMRVLDRLDTPAQVMSDLGETLVQNPMAVALLGDQTRFKGPARSAVYRWFTDPSERQIYPEVDRDRHGRAYVAGLRRTVAQAQDDGQASALVDDLRRASTEFTAQWNKHDVAVHIADRKRLVNARVGLLELHCQTLIEPNDSQVLLVFTATPGTEDQDKLQLLSVIGTQQFSASAGRSPPAP